MIQNILFASCDHVEVFLLHEVDTLREFQRLQSALKVSQGHLLQEMFDRDRLMSFVGLKFAHAANDSPVLALFVNAEAGEGLAGVLVDLALRVRDTRGHDYKE